MKESIRFIADQILGQCLPNPVQRRQVVSFTLANRASEPGRNQLDGMSELAELSDATSVTKVQGKREAKKIQAVANPLQPWIFGNHL
ncbi:hypothetical protein [Burkholderia pseudomallei]|uniref:hypothetical protein n=1 Tax=Burkholderia pseudomallei TaxID=28450 RepID=UPI001178340E|nr:hypothetical protein [Burkholderia pseudomallei]